VNYIIKITHLEEMGESPHRIRYLGPRNTTRARRHLAQVFASRPAAQRALYQYGESVPHAFRDYIKAEIIPALTSLPVLETPLEACIRIEKILRDTDAYHLSTDREGKVPRPSCTCSRWEPPCRKR